ncbi:MAG: hypothetical protein WCP65_08100, partial [Bacteroidota bacterium]
MASASIYLWTLPTGAIGSSNGPSIVLSFNSASVSGNLSVMGSNSCGNGNTSTKAITVNSVPVQPIVDSIGPITYGASNVAVTAHANGLHVKWFHTPYGGTSICNDTVYHTGTMFANDTVYVESFNLINTNILIGTDTLKNSNTSFPTPYGNFYSGGKEQYLILASELSALGAQSGNITNCGFNVITPSPASSYSNSYLKNFTVNLGATTLNALTSTFQTGLTQVYTDTMYKDVTGWNVHQFTAPFIWDGISNVIVQTCFDKYQGIPDYSYNAINYVSATPFVSTVNYHADAANVCQNTTGGLYSQRPNMKLGVNAIGCESPRTMVVLKVVPPAPTTYNMGGTIFAGLVPVDHAITYLYDSTFALVDSCNVDSLGFYNYYQKPVGNYKVKAELKSNSSFVNTYTPTYYTSKVFWNTADTIVLFSNQWAKDIHLHQVGTLTSGNGSLGGTVTTGLKTMQASFEVLLLDSASNPLLCRFTDPNGYFVFDNIKFGKYIVYPEVPGKITTPAVFTLNSSTPSFKNINFIVSSTAVVLNTKDIESSLGNISEIYPNPANDEIILDIIPKIKGTYTVTIINTLG